MQKNESSNSSSGVGNTKQSTPLVYWFLTWNNYTEDDWEYFSSKVPDLCKSWTYQEEIGESGTKHIQGVLEFKQKKRFEYLKKEFPEAHWEPCKSSAAKAYCSKKSFDGARQSSFPAKVQVYRPPHPIFNEIEELLKVAPDPRKIYWYWEPNGNIGKSAFCKYMYVTYDNVNVITTTKSADILTAIKETDVMIILDFPRCANPNVFCPFNALEQIKNGFITDAKLKKEARILCMNSPHLVVFANEPPNEHKLSLDRWIIKEI